VRIVPGGSAVRSGAYLGPGVVVMPPAYVNVGAYVGDGTMVDSHALVGSCAQVGKRVHLSAGAMLGGVLEPVGALPVIVEDEVLVGGNCGVYEGAIVGRRAVLGSGVILTGSVTVYDVPRQTTYRRTADRPLRIPEGAVVVPGSRRMTDAFAERQGLALYTPVIVKYRDEKTDGATALEEALR
jgi:2,3,4,5-tetrahydropyridine-2,6-dicarboxylate N-succinyltransferase